MLAVSPDSSDQPFTLTTPTLAADQAEFPFKVLALTALVGTMAVSSFTAVVGPVVRTLGMQEWHSGLAMTASGVTWTLMARRWGRLSDRVGRRRVLLLGLAVSAGFYLGLAVFLHTCLTFPPAVLWSVVGLVAFRAAIGCFHSALPPTTAAMVAANSSAGKRAAAMAKLGAANSAGMLVGPAVAGWLAIHWLAAPLYMAAVLPAVAWGVVWWKLPAAADAIAPTPTLQTPPLQPLNAARPASADHRSHGGETQTNQPVAGMATGTAGAGAGAAAVASVTAPSWRSRWQASGWWQPDRWLDRRLRLAGTVAWVSMLAISVSQISIGFFAIDRLGVSPEQGAALAGWSLTAVGLGLLVAQTGVMRLTAVASLTWIGAGAALATVGFVLIATAASQPWLLAAHVVAAMGMGMIMPSLQALAADAVEAHELGKASGTIASLQGLGMLIGPLAGTMIYRISPSAPYWTVAAALLVIALWVPFVKRGT